MKSLFLLRHAKAENATAGEADLDRSLNERGRQEAQAIGKYVKKQNLTFDLVLCSPATRARNTAELVIAAAEIVVTVRNERRIYEAGPGQLLEVISEVKNELSNLVLVGHNPGIEELLRLLTGRLEPMAPGTLAKIGIDGKQWTRVPETRGELDWVVRPKELVDG